MAAKGNAPGGHMPTSRGETERISSWDKGCYTHIAHSPAKQGTENPVPYSQTQLLLPTPDKTSVVFVCRDIARKRKTSFLNDMADATESQALIVLAIHNTQLIVNTDAQIPFEAR